ncbi:MAG: hypothetical protein F4W91_20830 [Gemmatimonadetes bacterium]|nr:hypothetical protein [Gemmatimonadota bacterium]
MKQHRNNGQTYVDYVSSKFHKCFANIKSNEIYAKKFHLLTGASSYYYSCAYSLPSISKGRTIVKKTRTLPPYLIPIVGLLVLAGVFSNALADCVRLPGTTPPAAPSVTAQQVEDGSATLKDFVLTAADQFKQGSPTPEEALYFGCLIRQEGGHWRSGSTYFVQLLIDGRIFVHTADMALSGRLLNPIIYGSILSALGVPLTVLADLSSPDPATVAEATATLINTLLQEPDAAFDATTPIPGLSPGIPGASGYATAYLSSNFGVPFILLGGFDLNETHVVEEDIDYGDPTITARDVVDRESLKDFVIQAQEFVIEGLKGGDLSAFSKLRIAGRDPNGP